MANDNRSEQAVLVYLDGVGVPSEAYEQHDLATLEDQLIAVLSANLWANLRAMRFEKKVL